MTMQPRERRLDISGPEVLEPQGEDTIKLPRRSLRIQASTSSPKNIVVTPETEGLVESEAQEDTIKLPRASGGIRAGTGSSTNTVVMPETEKIIEELMDSEVAKLLSGKRSKRSAKRNLFEDTWLIITVLISYIASISSFWYFFQTHQIILYGDAYAHMLITRRVFDNATPGLAQLGGVWLPLPHLVMLPFIWNDYLWRTGLAGTIPSMICYMIAATYLFLAARRLTKDSRASFIGTLLFILNPNVL